MAEKLAKGDKLTITNAKQIDGAKAGISRNTGKPCALSYTVAENLLLRVQPSGSRSWVFRYQSHGKVKELGLGKAASNPKGAELGLADARDKAADMRKAVKEGVDPRSLRKGKHNPTAMTFKAHAALYIKERETKHKAGKHKHRSGEASGAMGTTLARYVYPHIGKLAPRDIGYAHIQDIANQRDLSGKAETTYRVIQRVKVVLDEAAEHEHAHDRFNPAARYLTRKLKRDSRDVAHHPYAPVEAVPALYAALKAKDATSALCLRWSILTACRSGEARGALWSEIEGDMWAIPASRMKANNPHSVWLSDEAKAILEVMRERNPKQEGRIFPGPQGGLISDVAINKVLSGVVAKELGEGAKATAHGFRSTFRTWGAEADAKFSPEALKLCLAHIEANKVVAAYNRATMDAERRRILKAWSDYCSGSQDNSNVVPFKKSAT